MDGDEGVIFEDLGPGAVTRIWMTMGSGVSLPLDPTIRIRVYVDQDPTPVVDLPLPDLFNGKHSPFLPPLVGDRLVSSGGNYSYVPIPYRQGCRITLRGADDARIWFQINSTRLVNADGVTSFTGNEDLTSWSHFLDAMGSDPWPKDENAEITTGSVQLSPGQEHLIYDHQGEGLMSGLRLGTDPAVREHLKLRLTFDGQTTVDLPLDEFFAIGRGGSFPTRSALLGVDATEQLYSYMPMPYFETMQATLVYAPESVRTALGTDVAVDFWWRRNSQVPAPDSGLFSVQRQEVDQTTPGEDMTLLSVSGAGKWIGLFADLGTLGTSSRMYLEGDERIFLDGSQHPSLYGTGVEDLFSAGFYFDQGPFAQALHGMTYQDFTAQGDATTAYRFFLPEAITFASSIKAGLETGPSGQFRMRGKTVAYFYHRTHPTSTRRDLLVLGDAVSAQAHQLNIVGDAVIEELSSQFEGEPPSDLTERGLYRQAGHASFEMATAGCKGQPRLRKLLDAGHPGQAAVVASEGQPIAISPPIDVNFDRRWRQVDVDLDIELPTDVLPIEVLFDDSQLPPATRGTTLTEFRYELWCLMDSSLFIDGFESGNTEAWSTSTPVQSNLRTERR